MATQNSPIEFNLDKEEIEVSLKTKGSATPRECVLREMDGFERDKYLNSQRSKVDRDQNLKDFTDVQTSLVAQCLYEKGTDTLIPIQEIREFPTKTLAKLYDICMTLNGLDAKAEAAAKNS